MGQVLNQFVKSLNDVTVILLGAGGAEYLGRASRHYRHKVANLQVVTIESGSEHCALRDGTPKAELTPVWKQAIEQCLERIDTPFAVLVPDTDFLLIDALAESVAFLQANPQYSMCQGFALGYKPVSGSVGYHKIGDALADGEASITALERVRRHAACGLDAWRAVAKVDALLGVMKSAPLDLPLESWKVALSYGLLAEQASAILPVTTTLIEQRSQADAQAAGEAGFAQLVHALNKWDAQTWQLCRDSGDQQTLTDFARTMSEPGKNPLLFTSSWSEVDRAPERLFEPQQFIEMPYYTPALFNALCDLEFLVHSRPAGREHIRTLEGGWVRQQALLEVHPNDTPGSLQYRYLEAMAVGLFNPGVSERLLTVLKDEEDQAYRERVVTWLQRLQDCEAVNCESLLLDTPSGKVIQAIEQATPKGLARERVLRHLSKHPAPQLTLLVVDLENDDSALQRTFDSLLGSGLRTFKAIVLRTGELPAITTINNTVHFMKVAKGGLVTRLNQLVGQLKSDWLMILNVGDELAPGGALRLHVELSGADGCQAISANEVQRDLEGRLHSVVRPANNIELLRSRPDLMSRHWVIRRSAVQALGGFSEACPAAFEFDLLLRLIEQQGVSGFAHMDEYLVVTDKDNGALNKGAFETLKRHLAELGYRGQVNLAAGYGFQIDFRHTHTPMVSLLLPAGDNVELLKSCLASITQRTRYQRYEIKVIGDSRTPLAVKEYLSRFEGANGRVSVLWGERALARNEQLNMASGTAQGEYLVLLSACSQVVTPAWIESLLNQALRPEVGVVGCKMYNDDGTISHAGFELSGSGRVLAPWVGLARQVLEPALGVAIERGCHAVSSDCVMVRKSVFEQVQGLECFDANQIASDVDFCLKVSMAGLLTVWVPQAQVRNPGVDAGDLASAAPLLERWLAAFSTRAIIDAEHGIDVSRSLPLGQASALVWVEELEVSL